MKWIIKISLSYNSTTLTMNHYGFTLLDIIKTDSFATGSGKKEKYMVKFSQSSPHYASHEFTFDQPQQNEY